MLRCVFDLTINECVHCGGWKLRPWRHGVVYHHARTNFGLQQLPPFGVDTGDSSGADGLALAIGRTVLGCGFEESETTRRSPEGRPLVDKATCTNKRRCAGTAVCVVRCDTAQHCGRAETV